MVLNCGEARVPACPGQGCVLTSPEPIDRHTVAVLEASQRGCVREWSQAGGWLKRGQRA